MYFCNVSLRYDQVINERDILEDAGRVSAAVAEKLVLDEYEKFDRKRRGDEAIAADDFDATAKRLAARKPKKGERQ